MREIVGDREHGKLSGGLGTVIVRGKASEINPIITFLLAQDFLKGNKQGQLALLAAL